jgi:sporulation protein YlmC with PRC-barrel domain
MSGLSNVGDWRGHDVFTTDGDKLGKLEDVYYDADTNDPSMLCVKTGMLSHNQVLVPARDVVATPDRLTVAWPHDDLDGAPTTSPGEELTAEDEQRVFRHYGMEYTPPASPGGRRLVRR